MSAPTTRVQVTVSGEALALLDRIRADTGMERDADVVREALRVLEDRIRWDPAVRARCRPRGVLPKERVRMRRVARSITRE